MTATYQDVAKELSVITGLVSQFYGNLSSLDSDCKTGLVAEAREASQILHELEVEVVRYANIEAVKNGDAVDRDGLVDIVVAHHLLRYNEVASYEDWHLTELIQGSL